MDSTSSASLALKSAVSFTDQGGILEVRLTRGDRRRKLFDFSGASLDVACGLADGSFELLLKRSCRLDFELLVSSHILAPFEVLVVGLKLLFALFRDLCREGIQQLDDFPQWIRLHLRRGHKAGKPHNRKSQN